ncbi:hypothetical protein C0991_011472, partial [Blastosporella zonata]
TNLDNQKVLESIPGKMAAMFGDTHASANGTTRSPKMETLITNLPMVEESLTPRNYHGMGPMNSQDQLEILGVPRMPNSSRSTSNIQRGSNRKRPAPRPILPDSQFWNSTSLSVANLPISTPYCQPTTISMLQKKTKESLAIALSSLESAIQSEKLRIVATGLSLRQRTTKRSRCYFCTEMPNLPATLSTSWGSSVQRAIPPMGESSRMMSLSGPELEGERGCYSPT